MSWRGLANDVLLLHGQRTARAVKYRPRSVAETRHMYVLCHLRGRESLHLSRIHTARRTLTFESDLHVEGHRTSGCQSAEHVPLCERPDASSPVSVQEETLD